MTLRAEATWLPSLPELPFASCYIYSPGGTSAVAARSRLLRDRIKAADARWIGVCVARVTQESRPGAPLAAFFHPSDVLVPVPASTAGAVGIGCATLSLAQHLVRQGLGRSVWCGLARRIEVPKSATAAHGARPTVKRQLDSLGVVPQEGQSPPRLVLIDDVVSRGRTLLASAMRLEEAFPLATIRAFALLRTLGMTADIDRLLDPCVGTIRWRRGDAMRIP